MIFTRSFSRGSQPHTADLPREHQPKGWDIGRGNVITGLLDAEIFEFAPETMVRLWKRGRGVPCGYMIRRIENGEVDRTCPACGHAHGLLLFGVRASRMTAALANTLYASEQNEEDPRRSRGFLMFSDSVQDAAQRAAVAEITKYRLLFFVNLYIRRSSQVPNREMTLAKAISTIPEAHRQSYRRRDFVATYVALNQTWREQYQNLLQGDDSP